MVPYNASAGLSAELIARFRLAQQRWRDTTPAFESGTSTSPTTSGATGPGAKHAPTSSSGLTRLTDDGLADRLKHLEESPRSGGGPPLETYTTTPTEHGEVYRATDDFKRWMQSSYRGYGVGDHGEVPAPRREAQGVGAKKRFKQHAPLDTGGRLTP